MQGIIAFVGSQLVLVNAFPFHIVQNFREYHTVEWLLIQQLHAKLENLLLHVSQFHTTYWKKLEFLKYKDNPQIKDLLKLNIETSPVFTHLYPYQNFMGFFCFSCTRVPVQYSFRRISRRRPFRNEWPSLRLNFLKKIFTPTKNIFG